MRGLLALPIAVARFCHDHILTTQLPNGQICPLGNCCHPVSVNETTEVMVRQLERARVGHFVSLKSPTLSSDAVSLRSRVRAECSERGHDGDEIDDLLQEGPHNCGQVTECGDEHQTH